MNGIRLWGRATSMNVQKVLWALAELGLDAERIDAGGAYGGLDTATYGTLNPNRRVPTLEDGDLVLWESNVIVRYLASRSGDGILQPSTKADAAVSDQWMDWMQTTLAPPFVALFWEVVRKPPSQRDPQRIAQLTADTARAYAILDERLAEASWLGGDAFSMGDIPAGATLYRWHTMEIERPDLPRLAAWYDRLKEREAFRSTVMTSYEPLRGHD